VEDLVEVPDERAAVPEVHQLSLELSGEGLHLRDPLVAVPADPVQLPLWRETEAFLNPVELIRWTAALHELVDPGRSGVHERRRPKRVHEPVVRPDVEFELLFAGHVAGPRGIPPDGQLPPDPGGEAGDSLEEAAEIGVEFSGVLGERHGGGGSPPFTCPTLPRSGPGAF